MLNERERIAEAVRQLAASRPSEVEYPALDKAEAKGRAEAYSKLGGCYNPYREGTVLYDAFHAAYESEKKKIAGKPV